jgi:hypothetical protein
MCMMPISSLRYVQLSNINLYTNLTVVFLVVDLTGYELVSVFLQICTSTEESDIGGRILLKWILERQDKVMWTGLIWLRIETR